MDESRHNKRALIKWGILTVVFVLIIIFLLFEFTRKGLSAAEDQVNEQLTGEVSVWASELDSEVNKFENYRDTLLAYLNYKTILPEDQESLNVLKAIVDGTEVNKIFVLKEGEVIADERGIALPDGDYSLLNVGDIKAPVSLIVSGSQYGDSDCLAVIIPIELKRSLAFIVKLSDLTFTKSEYQTTSFLAIADKDGKLRGVIPGFNDSDSKFLEDENIISIISKSTGSNDSYSYFKVKMYNGESASLIASFKEDDRAIAEAKSQETGFYLIYGVRQASLTNLVNETFKSVKGTFVALCALIIIYSLIITSFMILNFIKGNERGKVLEDKADTDLLTELSNKAATERKIQEYIENTPSGRGMLFILDIDNFKKINDTMGHAFGDTLLKTLGKDIKVEFRVSDVVGRTGGDEFMIFLKDVNDNLIVEREANRIARFFHDFKAGEDYVKYSATASIGVAIFPDDAKTFKDLYIAADQALYRAKKRGKNQLVFYNEEEYK